MFSADDLAYGQAFLDAPNFRAAANGLEVPKLPMLSPTPGVAPAVAASNTALNLQTQALMNGLGAAIGQADGTPASTNRPNNANGASTGTATGAAGTLGQGVSNATQQAARTKANELFGPTETWTAYAGAGGSVVLKSADGTKYVEAKPSENGQRSEERRVGKECRL